MGPRDDWQLCTALQKYVNGRFGHALCLYLSVCLSLSLSLSLSHHKLPRFEAIYMVAAHDLGKMMHWRPTAPQSGHHPKVQGRIPCAEL